MKKLLLLTLLLFSVTTIKAQSKMNIIYFNSNHSVVSEEVPANGIVQLQESSFIMGFEFNSRMYIPYFKDGNSYLTASEKLYLNKNFPFELMITLNHHEKEGRTLNLKDAEYLPLGTVNYGDALPSDLFWLPSLVTGISTFHAHDKDNLGDSGRLTTWVKLEVKRVLSNGSELLYGTYLNADYPLYNYRINSMVFNEGEVYTFYLDGIKGEQTLDFYAGHPNIHLKIGFAQ